MLVKVLAPTFFILVIVISSVANKSLIELIEEFEKLETKEAKFAKMCDKLEADIQAKIYDEEGCVDLNNQEGNKSMNNERVQALLQKGYSWSDMWLAFGRERYNYDDNFLAVSNFANTNNITNLKR